MIPSQAVAISTQSSLASLPAMLRSAEILRVPVQASGVILPLAVAVFRVTGPAMNIAVVLYVAHWLGIQLGPAQIAAGIAAAAPHDDGLAESAGTDQFRDRRQRHNGCRCKCDDRAKKRL